MKHLLQLTLIAGLSALVAGCATMPASPPPLDTQPVTAPPPPPPLDTQPVDAPPPPPPVG